MLEEAAVSSTVTVKLCGVIAVPYSQLTMAEEPVTLLTSTSYGGLQEASGSQLTLSR